MPVNLTQLPDELLLDIFRVLDKTSLCAVALAGSQLANLIPSVLYQDVSFLWHGKYASYYQIDTGGPPEDFQYGNYLTPQPPVLLLLRSMMENSSLSSKIESLKIMGVKPYDTWVMSDKGSDPAVYQPSGSSRSIWIDYEFGSFEKERSSLLELIRSLPLPREDCEHWEKEFENGNMDVLIALLLTMLTRLKCLQLDSDFYRTSFLDRTLGFYLSSDHSTLANLERVKVCSDIDHEEDVALRPQSYEGLLSLFRRPKIQEISVSMPCIDNDWHNSIPQAPLKSLILHRSSIFEDQLGKLLQAAPELVSLEYDATYWTDDPNTNSRSWHDLLDPVKLENSLTQVKASLQHFALNINFFTFQGELPPFSVFNGPIKFLQKFENITSLELPWVVLLGWSAEDRQVEFLRDVMPPHLQSLTLKDPWCQPWYYPWSPQELQAFIEPYLQDFALGNRSTNTASIKILLEFSSQEWNDVVCDGFKALCSSSGVSGTVEKTPRYPGI